jgi:hypothetical protein
MNLLISLFAQAQLSESYTDKAAGFNGGFEKNNGKIPANWTMYTPQTAISSTFSLQMDTLHSYEGKYCVKWVCKQVSPTGGRFAPGLTRELEVVPGKKYVLKLWVRSNNVKFNVSLMAISAKCSVNEEEWQLTSSATDYWEEFSVYYTVPKDFNKVRMEFSITSPGTAYLDKVSFLPMK